MLRQLLILVLSLWPAAAVAQVQIAWNQPTSGVAVALDSGDNVFTARYEYNPGGDITVTKRDPLGALVWSVSYDQTDNTKWDKATWLAADPSGNVLISGTVMSGYSNPVNAASILMKYSPTGQLLWRNVYETGFDGSYTKKCLVDETGNIYVLGMGSGPAGYVTKVKKFAPDGTALWSYFDADGIGAPVNVKFAPDGDLVIAARAIFGSINGYARIDRDGQKVWSYPGVQSLTVGDAAGDLDGNTYLVHGVYQSGGGTTIRKLSPQGALLWSNDYAISAFRVEVGSDNRAVACGFPNAGSFGAAFLKVDESGGLLWSNPDADGPHALLSHAQLVLDADNNAYLAAGLMTAQAVCKVSSDGTSAWTATVPGGGYAYGIAVGSTGDIFMAGATTARLAQAGSSAAPEVMVESGLALRGGFPNPSTGNATIRYRLPAAGAVSLGLFDLAGREVLQLRSGVDGSGEKAVRADLSGLPAGTYFCRLQAGGEVRTTALRVVR